MIKEIFLPERLGRHRLLAQRMLGIAIEKNYVCAVCTYVKRSTQYLEQAFYEPIQKSEQEATQSEIAAALHKIIEQAKIKSIDQIRVAIPSSQVIFKELELPFINSDKIRMVLDYEVENLLPMDIEETTIDFIVTQELTSKNASHILFAAIRNQDLQTVLDTYQAAGINPTTVTIDLFSLYGLYQQIPEYASLQQATALVKITMTSTELLFIENGSLRLRRHIPKGLQSILVEASKIPADQVDNFISTAMDMLEKNGLQVLFDQAYGKDFEQLLIGLFNDIQFTLNAFSMKLNYQKGINKILFAGIPVHIKNFTTFSAEILQIPCELFESQKILTNTAIKNKIKQQITDWNMYAVALGTALPPYAQESFNLRRKQFAYDNKALLIKQLCAAGILILTILSFIGIQGYQQISTLHTTAQQQEHHYMNKLAGIIPKKDQPKKATLLSLSKKAEQLIKEKRELWSSFAQERIQYLDILLELTNILDVNQFNIDVDEIGISEKESGKPDIQISGYFKAKKGMGEHFTEWIEVQKQFENSPLLMPAELISPAPAGPDKGVRFSIRLKKREAQEG